MIALGALVVRITLVISIPSNSVYWVGGQGSMACTLANYVLKNLFVQKDEMMNQVSSGETTSYIHSIQKHFSRYILMKTLK